MIVLVVVVVAVVVAAADVIVVVDEDGGGFIDPDEVALIVLGLFRSDKQQNHCPYLYILGPEPAFGRLGLGGIVGRVQFSWVHF